MARKRHLVVGLATMIAVLSGSSQAVAIGMSLPGTATLSGLVPGQTASVSGISLAVTGVVVPWTLSVTPAATVTPGRLRATSGTCGGSIAALTSPLHVNTTAALPVTTTVDRSSYNIVSGAAQLAHGTVADVLTLGYTQAVSTSEAMTTGCVYSATLTYTLTG
jgi:hypothetical protein